MPAPGSRARAGPVRRTGHATRTREKRDRLRRAGRGGRAASPGSRATARPQPRYRTAKVERGPIVAVVAASGTLNAVTTVQVGSQVSGQIKEILADFNSAVKKDQIIARIDPSSFELRVNQTRADLDAARSAVAVQRSALAAQQAEIARAAGQPARRASATTSARRRWWRRISSRPPSATRRRRCSTRRASSCARRRRRPR